jgi:hypothetical protein
MIDGAPIRLTSLLPHAILYAKGSTLCTGAQAPLGLMLSNMIGVPRIAGLTLL